MAVVAEKTTRDQILDASDRIMARFGFRKMTMDDLAREAGTCKRTIYLHFNGKEDVGLSSIGRVVEGVHDRLREIKARPGTPASRLREMLVARVMGRVMAVQNYYESLDELFEAVRPAYMARRRRYFDLEVAMIAEVLDEGTSTGELNVPNSEAAATALLLATNAFLPYSLSVRELGEPTKIQSQLEQMIDLLLNGLKDR